MQTWILTTAAMHADPSALGPLYTKAILIAGTPYLKKVTLHICHVATAKRKARARQEAANSAQAQGLKPRPPTPSQSNKHF